MLRRYFPFMLCGVLFSLFSCGKSDLPLSIREEALIPILADVHLAEAALQNTYGAVKDSLSGLYYEQIFTIHGVSQADFEQTMSILREDPLRMERIYGRVLELLTEEEAKLQ